MIDALYKRYADPVGAMNAALAVGKLHDFIVYAMERENEEREWKGALLNG